MRTRGVRRVAVEAALPRAGSTIRSPAAPARSAFIALVRKRQPPGLTSTTAPGRIRAVSSGVQPPPAVVSGPSARPAPE